MGHARAREAQTDGAGRLSRRPSIDTSCDTRGEDFELCNECGGLCCCLYLAHDEDGEYAGGEWLPAYIEEWLARFVACGALVADGRGGYRAGSHGVDPLHDPRLSHRQDAEGAAYRASLPSWVDVRKCQFCHPETGCLLPRDDRAPLCREYVCELWRDAETVPVQP